jgi:hypothetical protein
MVALAMLRKSPSAKTFKFFTFRCSSPLAVCYACPDSSRAQL